MQLARSVRNQGVQRLVVPGALAAANHALAGDHQGPALPWSNAAAQLPTLLPSAALPQPSLLNSESRPFFSWASTPVVPTAIKIEPTVENALCESGYKLTFLRGIVDEAIMGTLKKTLPPDQPVGSEDYSNLLCLAAYTSAGLSQAAKQYNALFRSGITISPNVTEIYHAPFLMSCAAQAIGFLPKQNAYCVRRNTSISGSALKQMAVESHYTAPEGQIVSITTSKNQVYKGGNVDLVFLAPEGQSFEVVPCLGFSDYSTEHEAWLIPGSQFKLVAKLACKEEGSQASPLDPNEYPPTTLYYEYIGDESTELANHVGQQYPHIEDALQHVYGIAKADGILATALQTHPNLNRFHPASLKALVAYSSCDFHASIQQYRRALREQNPDELARLSQFVPVLEQTILAMIPLLPRSRHFILHRNTKMSAARIATILKNQGYVVPGTSIQSTTAVGQQIVSKGNVDMVILPAEEGGQIEAADLCGLTQHPIEQEHFLIPGTQLQLVESEEKKQDRPGLPEGLEELNNHGSQFPATTLYFRCTHVPPQQSPS